MARHHGIWTLLAGAIMTAAIAAGPAIAQVSRESAKAWGDECIRTSKGPSHSLSESQRCCDAAAKKGNKACNDDPSNVVCVNSAKVCKEMVKCDYVRNACKIKIMETDKNCSTDACKKCTEDYKTCHDGALN
jgi:hypothetical protein